MFMCMYACLQAYTKLCCVAFAQRSAPPITTAYVTVVIWWVSPRVGSIVGGTLLNIQGSEFAVDAFTSSNIVWLEGEGTRVICDVIRLAVFLYIYTS